MSYEPRGKVAILIAAMQAAPEKVLWSAAEVAATMGITTPNLQNYLGAAIKHEILFRKLDGYRSVFSLKPFEEAARQVQAAAEPTTPSWSPWSPPKMVAPRGEQRFPAVVTETPAPPAEPQAPAAQVESQPEPAGEETPADAGNVPFDACQWLDGDLDLYGLIEIEGGGHRIKAADVLKLRRKLAWMPC